MTLCESCHAADPHHPHDDCGDKSCHCDCRPWETFSVRMPRSKVAQLRAEAQSNYRSLSGQAAALLSESLNGSEECREVQRISEPFRADLQSREHAALDLDLPPQGQDPDQEPSSSDAKAPDPEYPEPVPELTDELVGRVRSNGFKVTDRQAVTWRGDVDRLLRIDGKDPVEVREVLRWATEDEFWRANIRSAAKLREKYPALVLRMRQPSLNGARDGPKPNFYVPTDADYEDGRTF